MKPPPKERRYAIRDKATGRNKKYQYCITAKRLLTLLFNNLNAPTDEWLKDFESVVKGSLSLYRTRLHRDLYQNASVHTVTLCYVRQILRNNSKEMKSSSLSEGMNLWALYDAETKKARWYPGSVASVDNDGFVTILFGDGDIIKEPASDIAKDLDILFVS